SCYACVLKCGRRFAIGRDDLLADCKSAATFTSSILYHQLGRTQGVVEQHGDGHGPDAAGNGADCRCDVLDTLEIDVAGRLAVGQAIHADIDDHGTRPDHIGLEKMGLAEGGHKDIRPAGDVGQVAALAVADRDGGVGPRRLLHQDQSERFAYNVAAADDHHVPAFDFDAVAQ